jgi:hypothetical protein
MRRSLKQDHLLAVCSKMGEVVPLLTDGECDACEDFLKNVYERATASVESVSSPAFQNLSLRELLIKKEDEAGGAAAKKTEGKKSLGKSLQRRSVLPRAPSKRKVTRKRALWGDEGEEEEVAKKAPQQAVQRWDAKKHGVIVDVVSHDKDALIVDAKLSAHGRSKVHHVAVHPADIDEIEREYWPKMATCFKKHKLPASFAKTQFAAFCADNK